MGDALRHNGKDLGWIHSYTGDSTKKFDLEMEGISGIEQLFRLSDEETLEVEGMPPMTFREFKTKILRRTKRIYLFPHEYGLNLH
ncbi:hypothetical protein J4402_02000 [Candidatus Pacearchaeota archaeon]|nr:hypothetical protein [uncultured archaeon]AQS31834.1 hypothetical protein [uncultured archaeon]MBS3088530.1 hypothetical protein [Candidatus Pacearchaeota archaeon]